MCSFTLTSKNKYHYTNIIITLDRIILTSKAVIESIFFPFGSVATLKKLLHGAISSPVLFKINVWNFSILSMLPT